MRFNYFNLYLLLLHTRKLSINQNTYKNTKAHADTRAHFVGCVHKQIDREGLLMWLHLASAALATFAYALMRKLV